MDKKDIFKDLGYSIRKTNKDEIEIKLSFLDGFLRGGFRLIFIGIVFIISLFDLKNGNPPLSKIYNDVKHYAVWTFNPDVKIQELYKTYRYDEYIKENSFLSEDYLEFRKPYLEDNFCVRYRFYGYLFVFFIASLLIFYPHHRTLRLNRKHRVLYSQNIMGTGVVPVPDKGDPLAGVLYDRFSDYPFGGGERFLLFLMLKMYKGKARDGFFLGIYPTPNRDHNEHLIRAMREFFTEENPEFLKYIGRCYRTPWFRPLMAFCNSFSPIYFLPFRRKKAEQAIAAYLAEWNKLTRKQKQAKYAAVQARQIKMNEDLKKQGFYNEVDNRWTWRD